MNENENVTILEKYGILEKHWILLYIYWKNMEF